MKATDVEVGKVYMIRHHGSIGLVAVRVDAIDKYNGMASAVRTRYRCTKLATGREILVRSAAKFRREAIGPNHV